MKLTRPIVFFDIESAGDANVVDASRDRIIEFAAIKFTSFGDAPMKWSFTCNPGIPIVKERSDVHGFTDAMVSDMPPFSFFALRVLDFINGCDLGGFNLFNYDIPLLWEELYRCGTEWDLKGIQVVDVGNIFKKQESRDLSAGVKFYCGREHVGAHGALSDCEATAEILAAQRQRYSDLATMDIGQLAAFSRMDDRVDLAGIIVRNKDGEPVFNTKRNKGIRVTQDVGYAEWMLRSDFSAETKKRIREIIYAD